MTAVIKLKRSTTASSIPTTGDLADGEVAVNIVDKKIYVRNGASIVEVANNASAGSTDLTSVGTNIIGDTDNTYDIGSLTSAFRDIFFKGALKQRVPIFTITDGLGSATTTFTLKAPNRIQFGEVYTRSGGLLTAASDPTVFNDANPAYEF